MNKLIIAGVVASVALSAFVLFLQQTSVSKVGAGQSAALSSAAHHFALSAPVKKPSNPITPPATS